MPRLPTTLVKQALRIHSHLPLLLRPCRDLGAACNELRWLAEYQKKLAATTPVDRPQGKRRSKRYRKTTAPTLLELCLERSRGRPLQYIIGTQPFGSLDILCRKGVLIPRPETEAYIELLIARLLKGGKPRQKQVLKILDLGTGTGCIALLLASRLHQYFKLRVLGIDISPKAVALAKRNLQQAIVAGALPSDAADFVFFRQDDMTSKDFVKRRLEQHITICNPPYISSGSLRSEAEHSVRAYEPREALVADPPDVDELTKYEKALIPWFSGLHSGMCLVEFVNEKRAQLFIEHLRRNGQVPNSSPGILRRTTCSSHLEVWRESTLSGATPKSPLPTTDLQHNTRILPKIFDEGVGAVRAIVGYYKTSAPNFSVDAMASHWEPAAASNRPVTESEQSRPEHPVVRKVVTQHEIPRESTFPHQVDISEALVEALDGVAELSRLAGEHSRLRQEMLTQKAEIERLQMELKTQETEIGSLHWELKTQQTEFWEFAGSLTKEMAMIEKRPTVSKSRKKPPNRKASSSSWKKN